MLVFKLFKILSVTGGGGQAINFSVASCATCNSVPNRVFKFIVLNKHTFSLLMASENRKVVIKTQYQITKSHS